MERVESVEGVEGIFFEGNLRIGKQFDPPLPSTLHFPLHSMLKASSNSVARRRRTALAAMSLA
jgi:hypothetical protein